MAKTSLKTHFNLTPEEYEQHRQGHLEDRRRRLVEQEVAASAAPGATVLELGCGPGELLARLASTHPDVTFLGFDVEPKMIDYARSHYTRENAAYEVVDLAEQQRELTVDFAYSIDLLHHVRNLRPFVGSLYTLLRPGATWLAIEPNIFHPFIFWSQGRLRRAGFDEDHFRPWVAEAAFRETGLVVGERQYAFFFPSWIQRVPTSIAWLEPLLERFRLFGGSVVYHLERPLQ